jgi:hypothetical protein
MQIVEVRDTIEAIEFVIGEFVGGQVPLSEAKEVRFDLRLFFVSPSPGQLLRL